MIRELEWYWCGKHLHLPPGVIPTGIKDDQERHLIAQFLEAPEVLDPDCIIALPIDDTIPDKKDCK